MAVQDDRTPVAPDPAAHLVNTALGIWLFISAFIWPHAAAQRTNTWILGVLTVIFSLAATSNPRIRNLNTILAIWLFVSAWALPHISAATVLNNMVVAIAIFLLSLAPPIATRPRGVSSHA